MNSAENIITVKNLYKRYGNFIANDNLSFTVKRGEIFGFLGANGAGKTTTIKILCGLSLPTEGMINIAGYDVYKDTDRIKKVIGYMSQKFSLYEDLTVSENIKFYGGIYGLKLSEIRERTMQLLSSLELVSVKDKLICELPAGWRQKLAFSVAMIHNPQIVFLDEPTGGVDPITRRQFWAMIYETANRGVTIFVTTHYMDEAEYCHRVTIMAEGKIVALDTPETLMKTYKAENMNQVFLMLARNKET